KHEEDETRLDMNALIDVCLVLLIFFILTTTYVAAVQKTVPLPTVPDQEKKKSVARKIRADQVRRQMIRIRASGDKAGKVTVFVEGQTVPVIRPDGVTLDADKLRDALLPYVRGEDQKTQVLLDARGVTWGMVIAIQDAARSAGIRTVSHLYKK